MTRAIPQAAIDLVKSSEGLFLHSYRDSAGVLTVGWGSTRGVYPNMVIDENEALTRLENDLQQAASSVIRLIRVPLNDNQYASLVDFTFNEGSGRLQSSSLRMKLNRGEYNEVPTQLLRFVYAGGRVLPGLITRRRKEANLFMS